MAKIIYGSNEITLDYGKSMTLLTKNKFCEHDIIVETSKNEYLKVAFIAQAQNGEVLTLHTKGNTCDSDMQLISTEKYYFTVNGTTYSVLPGTSWQDYIEEENSPFNGLFGIFTIDANNAQYGISTGDSSKPILVDSNGEYVDYYSDIKSDDYSHAIDTFSPWYFTVTGWSGEEHNYETTKNTSWQKWINSGASGSTDFQIEEYGLGDTHVVFKNYYYVISMTNDDDYINVEGAHHIDSYSNYTVSEMT